MAITIACPSCERKFQAPPQFEGKRVKCKGCGEIFAVPSSATASPPTDSDTDDTLTELAQSAHGFDRQHASRVGMTSLAGNNWDTNSDKPSGDNRPSASGLSPNVLTFSYPGAADIDRWLPITLIVFCLLMLADVVTGPDTREFAWIAATRFLTVAVFYWALIFPLTLLMIKKAARESRFAMPPQPQLRCFASYMPAFLLATWLFSQAGGNFVIQLFGCILGLALSSALLWLLFRLREPDIVTFCVQGAGGFLGGLLASIALIIVLNMTVQMMISDAKSQKLVPVSPFAACLGWLPAQQPIAADRPQKQVTANTASPTFIPPPTLTPSKPFKFESTIATSSSLVDRIENGKIPGVIDGVIEPLSKSPLIAILRNTETGITIEPWSTLTWAKSIGTLQLPVGAAKKFVVSTDGQKLAWIAEFPRLSVQVWSFTDATVSSTITLDKSEGIAELIGFVDTDRLLIERGNAKPVVSPPVDVIPIPVPVPVTDSEPARQSVFGGFKANPDQISREHAAAQRNVPESHPGAAAPTIPPINAHPPSIVAENFIPAHAMEIIDTTAGTTVCNFNLPALITDFVTSGPASNVFKASLHLGTNMAISTTVHRLVAAATSQDTPTLIQIDLLTGKTLPNIKIAEIDPSMSGSLTGLAYSNDGTRIATLFEHNESALLLAFDAASGKKVSEHVYPYGPLEGAPHGQIDGGALIWLDPAPFWLLYGQGFINIKTGAHLKSADLGLGTIISQRVLDGDRIQLLGIENSGRRVSVADLRPAAVDDNPQP